MKIQINTITKTIKIKNNITFKELIKSLDGLFPKKEWHDYELITDTIINNWSNPIIIKDVMPREPYKITCCGNNAPANTPVCLNIEC